MDSNENEEKNIQDLNEIPPKDHLKTNKNQTILQTYYN